MASPNRVRAVRALYYVVGGAVVLLTLAPQLHGLRDWLFVFAFYGGAGSMAFLFQSWRGKGSLLARNWCLSAFGLWALGVFVASSAYVPGSVICGTALLVGAIGAVLVLLRKQSRTVSEAAERSR
jgi:hypothetical protein